MPVTHHEHWYDQTEQNGYPLDAAATRRDDAGQLLPAGLVLDLQLRFPRSLGQYAFVGGLVNGPRLVAVTLLGSESLETVEAAKPLAVFAAAKPLDPRRQYPLKPLAEGVGGWLALGSGVLDPAPGSWRCSTAIQSLLYPRAARPYRDLPVPFVRNRSGDAPLRGLVRLHANSPLQLTRETLEILGRDRQAIVFRLVDDQGDALSPGDSPLAQFIGPCGIRAESLNCPLPFPIQTISLVEPDCDGQITLEFRDCAIPIPYRDGGGMILRCDTAQPLLCPPDYIPDAVGRLPREYEPLVLTSTAPPPTSSTTTTTTTTTSTEPPETTTTTSTTTTTTTTTSTEPPATEDSFLVASNDSSTLNVLRYTPEGFLDWSFGSCSDRMAAVVRQGDGKLVVAGYIRTFQHYYLCALARFNSDGTPDTGFGRDGRVFHSRDGSLPSSYDLTETAPSALGNADQIVDLAIDGDGKIVALGITKNDENYFSYFVARYASDGDLDATFGTGGIALVDFGTEVTTSFPYEANRYGALLIQGDGKIVLAGQVADGFGQFNMAIARLTSAGALDTGWGGTGLVTVDIATSTNSMITGLAQQGDGKIVGAGWARTGGTRYDITLIRFETDGDVDTTFGDGVNGWVVTNTASKNTQAYALGVQADGSLVVGGTYVQTVSSDNRMIIQRYDEDGVLDATFGTSGSTITDLGGTNFDEIRSLWVQDDDYLVVAGVASSQALFYLGSLAVLRYDPDGTLDAGFGTGGVVTTAQDVAAMANAVLVDPDDNIVVAGWTIHNTHAGSSAQADYNYDALLARYDSAGALDAGFGSGGITVWDFNTGAGTAVAFDDGSNSYPATAQTQRLGRQSDGKIILCGFANNTRICLARLQASGLLDRTFGTDGVVQTTVTGFASYPLDLLVCDSDVLVVGSRVLDGHFKTLLLKYDEDGVPDAGFGTAGKLIYDWSRPTFVTALAQGPVLELEDPEVNTTIYVAGDWIAASSPVDQYFLARFMLSDGSVDATFNSGGGEPGITQASPMSNGNLLQDIAVQADGRIVANGYCSDLSDEFFGVVRWEEDGDLDATFGVSGIVTLSMDDGFSDGHALAIQDDQRILVGGESFGSGNYTWVSARLDTDGDLDGGWGTSGRARYSGTASAGRTVAFILQSNGRIVAVGFDGGLLAHEGDGDIDTTFASNGDRPLDWDNYTHGILA